MDQHLPTLSDVARRAGVSYATADRVVNDRGGVAEKSAKRVREAIEMLGYVRNVAAANLSQRRTYRFAAVIPVGTNAFFGRMRAILEAERARLLPDRVDLSIEEIAAFDPDSLCFCLDELFADGVDGIAMVGMEDSRVAQKIDELHEAGVAVLTLVSDVPGSVRDHYIGIDNRVAGRTAARMIGLAHGGRPGRVLPIVGSLSAPDHADRLAGLRETLSECFAEIAIAPEIEGRDRHEIVEAQLREGLPNDTGITAIYSVGGGNAGMLRVLDDLQEGAGRPIVVLHELVPHSRRALDRGLIDVVIDQCPEQEIATALDYLRNIADRRTVPDAGLVLPVIYIRENLPPEGAAEIEGEPTT